MSSTVTTNANARLLLKLREGADLCAVKGVEAAESATSTGEGEFGPLAAKHFAQAALAYTQAYLTLSRGPLGTPTRRQS